MRQRPERPLSLSATAGQLAITSSPVSAAMAAMVGLLAPKGFGLTSILMIVFPASLLAIVVGGFVMNRIGKNLPEDVEYQRRLAAGEVAPPATGAEREKISGKPTPRDMSLFIEMAMLGVSALIVAFCGVKASGIPKSSLFSSGLVAVVALFGVAWMANTFIAANETVIVGGLGDLARQAPLLISVALFAVAAITTSQSSTTFSIIPIGIALGIPPQFLAAMWPSVVGVFLLPTNGAQIATVEIDQTGTTRIGSFVINHSFLIPVIVYTVVSVGTGLLIASVL